MRVSINLFNLEGLFGCLKRIIYQIIIIKNIVNRTNGVNVHVTPHVFRHTTASVSLERGTNVVEVSKLLGHSKVETTMEYITTDSSTLKSNHKNCVI